MPETECVPHCSAAKLCHFVSHGGQIILPNELAEVVLADWTGSVPPMPSAGQSLFLTAHHGAGSNLTGSNWDSAKSSPASDMSRYMSHTLSADLKVIVKVYVTFPGICHMSRYVSHALFADLKVIVRVHVTCTHC